MKFPIVVAILIYFVFVIMNSSSVSEMTTMNFQFNYNKIALFCEQFQISDDLILFTNHQQTCFATSTNMFYRELLTNYLQNFEFGALQRRLNLVDLAKI